MDKGHKIVNHTSFELPGGLRDPGYGSPDGVNVDVWGWNRKGISRRNAVDICFHMRNYNMSFDVKLSLKGSKALRRALYKAEEAVEEAQLVQKMRLKHYQNV